MKLNSAVLFCGRKAGPYAHRKIFRAGTGFRFFDSCSTSTQNPAPTEQEKRWSRISSEFLDQNQEFSEILFLLEQNRCTKGPANVVRHS